ncbi:MAG: response regulator [Clostridia bacterium]|nr:response regulator [Clostridia bacterium]
MIRILIVDDEAPIRDLLAQTISAHGEDYAVVGVAGDGDEAIERCRELRPDIIITDICMPAVSGLEFLQTARAEGLLVKTVIISGYDEFDYARQAISLGVTDYLLKPFLPGELFEVLGRIKREIESQRMLMQNMDSLQTLVDKQRWLVREKLYTQLVRGTLRSIPEPGEPESGLFDFEAPFYCAGQIHILGSEHEAQVWDERRSEELAALLEEYFGKQIRLYTVTMSGTQTVLLFAGYEEGEELFHFDLRNGIECSQNSLRRHFNLHMRCALGSVKEDWRQLCDSYEEAQSAWRSQMKADKQLLVYGETGGKTPSGMGDATKQIRQLKTNILLEVRLGNLEKALERLEALMKCYAALSSKKSDYIFISAGELVYAISNELEEQYGTLHDGLLRQVEGTRRKLEYSSLMEMKSALEAFVTASCKWVQSREESGRSKRLIGQVCSLIDGELSNQELSLEWVAARLNFSPHYIRQIFKQHMGEAFSDYVIRKRMEKAGTLLRTSGMLVQDVALTCGYANQRYFASSFKKYYGRTPTDYKQMVGRQEDI